ncbi:hypothetical protein DFH28DRAFT_925609 [Melampsora americana]|nr:hypothetical protein DFH28DRAFT_925609 [Melampsora americana]
MKVPKSSSSTGEDNIDPPKSSSSTGEDNSNPPKSSSSTSEENSNPSWNTTLPPPPAGVFEDQKQLKQHLDTHSIPHGYKISVLDTRPLCFAFKFAKGATQYAKSCGTSPFFVQATWSSIKGPWTLETHIPRHDHQLSTNEPWSQIQIEQMKKNIKASLKADLEDEDSYEIQIQLTPHSKAKQFKSKKILPLDSEEDEEQEKLKSKH